MLGDGGARGDRSGSARAIPDDTKPELIFSSSTLTGGTVQVEGEPSSATEIGDWVEEFHDHPTAPALRLSPEPASSRSAATEALALATNSSTGPATPTVAAIAKSPGKAGVRLTGSTSGPTWGKSCV